MMYAIHYDTRESVTTKADLGELMKAFGERGEMPGTVGHWSYPGGGGILIVDQDDPTVVFETALAYTQWLDCDIKPVIPVDDAVGKIIEYLAS